jgi:ribonuclease BN (tRNA processing enzyme)
MRLTVLGGWGGWPAPGGACSGYLLDHDGFRLLVDPGYAVVPRLLQVMSADDVDAVLVSHGHPDHCADINPLLRVRAMQDRPPPALPLFALPGALDAVLALDRPSMLADAYVLHEFEAGQPVDIGPYQVRTRLLPHPRPNAGFRIEAGGHSLAYTGDAGPSAAMAELARGVELLLAEASYVDEVPEETRGQLSSAIDAGALAVDAGVSQLVLTHLMPGTDAQAALRAASSMFPGPIAVAVPELSIELGRDIVQALRSVEGQD